MPDATPWTFSAAGQITERLDWLTDPMQAVTGPEQRRRLRIAPRTFLGFETLESRASRRHMETLLIANGAGEWLAPLWQDAADLESAWVAGSPSPVLAVDTTLRRFRVGGSVLLIRENSRVFDVGVVASVEDGELELEDGPALSWPAGTAVVPLVLAKIDAMPALSRFTSDDVPALVSFRVTEPLDWGEDAGDADYRGVPVLEWIPDGAQDPGFTPERRLGRVDAESGRVTEYDQPGIPLSLQVATFTLVGREEIGAFRSLLYALAGRWGAIWVPTWSQDLQAAAAVTSASTLLDIDWCGFSQWPLSPNRRDLRIELVDGTVLYRRITAVAEISPSVERLVLDAAWGLDADVAEIRLISFLMLARQDTDVNLFRYWSHEVVETELRLRGFRDDDV